jgi:hypothetical protein
MYINVKKNIDTRYNYGEIAEYTVENNSRRIVNCTHGLTN